MQGTIKRNNVLEEMTHYDCYKDTPQHRVENTTVEYGGGSVGHKYKAQWAHRMTIDCCYDKFMKDERCYDKEKPCQVYKDWEALKRFGINRQ